MRAIDGMEPWVQFACAALRTDSFASTHAAARIADEMVRLYAKRLDQAQAEDHGQPGEAHAFPIDASVPA